MIATLRAGGASARSQIMVPPLYFAAAHMHHAHEIYTQRGRTACALRAAVATTAVQVAYTTLFGWYAGYLFVRTGTVVAPLAAHMLCNSMGLPRLPDEQYPAARRIGSLALTVAITLLVFGTAGFMAIIYLR